MLKIFTRFSFLSTSFLLLLFLFPVLVLQAQTKSASISGQVLDDLGEAAPFANVILFSQADSSMVKGEASDANGFFKLNNLAAATYWLEVSSLGFDKFQSEPISLGAGESKSMDKLSLSKGAVSLETFEIKTERALIEVQPDKTVFNVDGSINAVGNTALELLRKSPGVLVDNNDNIILSGKDGVQVYIDGKPSPLRGEDLSAYLSSMQSTEIDAIDIITNPSAKYDAAGNAGIINIRLKKDKSLGANANFNAGYAYGINHRYNAGISGNYRNKKVNLFGSYNFNGGDSRNWIDFDREQSNFTSSQETIRLGSGENHAWRLGTDFFINKKSTIGFLINGANNEQDSYNTSSTYSLNEVDDIAFNLDAISDNDGIRRNNNINLNFSHQNDDGSTWNVDGDWGTYINTLYTYQPNTYTYTRPESSISPINYSSDADTKIDIYSAKVDHERNIGKGKLGLGLKSATVITDNDFSFYELVNDVAIVDTQRTSNFVYTENVNAAYANYAQQLGKFNLSAGLRAEQTRSEGRLLTILDPTQNDTTSRSYINYFPSAGLSYQLNRKHQLRLNYSRRIDRPSYQDLNPFEYKLDELTFRRGNENLKPQYANNYSISHTYNYRFTTSLSYTYTKDFIANITDIIDIVGLNPTFLQSINMDYQKVYNLSVSLPFSITDWWSTYTNLGGYHKRNYANLGEGRVADIRANVFNMYHQSTFSLPQDFAIELSGWYNSPGIWGAVYATDAIYSINVGIQKKLFNGAGNLKVSMDDILYTSTWRGVQEFSGFYSEARGGWESRQLKVNFSYLFGNQQVKKSRKRETGIEDATKRVK